MTHGFTLIEVLVVTALIALAFVATTPMLLGVADATRLETATERFADLDARARLLAASGLGAVIEYRNEMWCLRADGADREPDRKADTVATWSAEGVSISLESPDGEYLNAVVFDRRGRSIDYRVRIANDAGTRTLSVAGLTGWIDDETQEVP